MAKEVNAAGRPGRGVEVRRACIDGALSISMCVLKSDPALLPGGSGFGPDALGCEIVVDLVQCCCTVGVECSQRADVKDVHPLLSRIQVNMEDARGAGWADFRWDPRYVSVQDQDYVGGFHGASCAGASADPSGMVGREADFTQFRVKHFHAFDQVGQGDQGAHSIVVATNVASDHQGCLSREKGFTDLRHGVGWQTANTTRREATAAGCRGAIDGGSEDFAGGRQVDGPRRAGSGHENGATHDGLHVEGRFDLGGVPAVRGQKVRLVWDILIPLHVLGARSGGFAEECGRRHAGKNDDGGASA